MQIDGWGGSNLDANSLQSGSVLDAIQHNDSMDKVIDPSKCPICGESNQCAQEIAKATGTPPERCWCMTATFSPEVLDRVPVEAKNKACICSKCVSATAF